MSIERYAWVPGDPLPDCPEKRFVLAFIIQLVQDAQSYGDAPPEDITTPRYLESTTIHANCVTSDQFRWWCEVLGMSAWRLASVINDLMRGKKQINKRQVRVGRSWEEYDDGIGFQVTPREKVVELANKGVRARRLKAKA